MSPLAPCRSRARAAACSALAATLVATLVGCTPPKATYAFRASPLEADHAVALTGDEIMGRGRPPEQWVEVASGRALTERFPDIGAMEVDGIGDEIKRYSRDDQGCWFLDSVDAIGDRSRSGSRRRWAWHRPSSPPARSRRPRRRCW